MTAPAAAETGLGQIRVDGDRLRESLDAMGHVGGRPDGGVDRVALTAADVAGRELLADWLEQLGCPPRTDVIGNQFARRRGASSERAPVLIGSHLDSQPGGGRYDGALGVLAGLEVLRALDDHGVTTAAPVELVNWTDEEGARFGVSCIGSSVHTGALALDQAHRLVDADGVTLRDALLESGQVGDGPVGAVDAERYFELHIEQGPVLERSGAGLGAVEAIQAIRWVDVTISGEATHAGTTPVRERRDALLAAARLVVELDRIAAEAGPDARAAACRVIVTPNAGSVIAGGAQLLADLRHPDGAVVDAMHAALCEAAASAAEVCRVSCDVRSAWDQPRIEFDAAAVALVEATATRLGLRPRRLVSRAGHDAGYLAGAVPSAMLFVPCRGGISHHPDEHVAPDDVEAAANALLHVVLDAAA